MEWGSNAWTLLLQCSQKQLMLSAHAFHLLEETPQGQFDLQLSWYCHNIAQYTSKQHLLPNLFWKVREHKISKTQSEQHDRTMAFLSCSIIWGVNDAPQPHQGMLIQSCVSEREGKSLALSSLIPRVWSHLLLCTSPNHQAWKHVRACPSNCCQVKFCN